MAEFLLSLTIFAVLIFAVVNAVIVLYDSDDW